MMRPLVRFLAPLVLALGLFPACKEKSAPQAESPGTAPAAGAVSPSPIPSGPTSDTAPDDRGALAGTVGEAAVWFDVRVPDASGKVAGSYLYVKHGKDIPVSGERRGDTLILNETTGGKVTGVFTLSHFLNDSEGEERWVGTWKSPGRRKGADVLLKYARPDFRSCHVADPRTLMISEEVSLAAEMASKSVSDEDLAEQEKAYGESIPPPYFRIAGCSQGLMTVEYTVYFYPYRGPIIEHSTYVWTFDLARKQVIGLWGEIDSSRTGAFSEYLADQLTPELRARRKALDEAEAESRAESEGSGTAESSGAAEPAEPAGPDTAADTASFEISNLESAEIKVEGGKLMAGFLNYFEVSVLEAAGTGNGNRELWVELDPAELRRFLRKNSVLYAFTAGR